MKRTWNGLIILFFVLGMIAGCSNFGSDKDQTITINRQYQEISNKSSLMLASEIGDQQWMREALMSGESVNAIYQGKTALNLALEAREFEFARLLLRAGISPDLGYQAGGDSAMMHAARVGATQVIRQLIQMGRDIDYVDNQGYSALAVAALGGHLTSVNVLINAGANVNVKPEGRSLLMHCVAGNHMIIVQPLIAAGADLNFVDAYGETALSIARQKGYHELDLMLVQAGARL